MPKDLHLKDWIKIKLQQYNISSFYYLAHKNNLEGILKYGILPKNEVIEKGLDSTSFAEIGVQERRDAINIALAEKNIYNIHDMVPLYLTPKTPTLFCPYSGALGTKRKTQYPFLSVDGPSYYS